MPLSAHDLGRLGERVAARHLARRGYRLLARNWTSPRGELDLVLRRRRSLVFVEVKTRRDGAALAAVDAVDEVKRRRLRRVAADYLATHPFQHWEEIRLDLVAVTMRRTGEVVEIRHFEDAL